MTKEQEQLLTEWFDTLWKAYPSDLCKNKKGGRMPALKALLKINPDESERNRILIHIREQSRIDRSDKDAYRWPFLSTFLNQRRYDDYIITETTEKKELTKCTVDGCNSDVHGYNYKYCSFHIPSQHDDALKKAFRDTKLDYKSKDFVNQCRQMCKDKFRTMINRE